MAHQRERERRESYKNGANTNHNLITIFTKNKVPQKRKKERKRWQHCAAWLCACALVESAHARSLIQASARSVCDARQIFLKYFVFTIAESSFLLILLFSIIFNLKLLLFCFEFYCVRVRKMRKKGSLLRLVCFFLRAKRRETSNSHRYKQQQQTTHTDMQNPPSNKSTQIEREASPTLMEARHANAKQNKK